MRAPGVRGRAPREREEIGLVELDGAPNPGELEQGQQQGELQRPQASSGGVRRTIIRSSVMSSIAKRTPSRPMPLPFTPP